jgi:osmoprotectant transport system substrate-binding protein
VSYDRRRVPNRPLRIFAASIACLLTLAVAGCGGDDGNENTGSTSKGSVTIGSKNFTESIILGEVYKQALEAKGYDVKLQSSIGSTEIIDKSLRNGHIDLYPEYTGTMLTAVYTEDEPQESAESTYARAKELYEEDGFTLFAKTPFTNSDALAVTKATAARDGLAEIGDLTKLDSFKLGGLPEFATRLQGLPGLEKAYGIEHAKVEFIPLSGNVGSSYEALSEGTVDVAAIFSTDPQLASGRYVVLEDTKAVFGFQNVAPVVSQKVADELGAGFRDALDAVSAKLTQEAVISMNSAVTIQKHQVADVARAFLIDNGLLTAKN